MCVSKAQQEVSRVLPADPFFTKYNLNESGRNYFDTHFLSMRSSWDYPFQLSDLNSNFTGYLNPAFNNPVLKIK